MTILSKSHYNRIKRVHVNALTEAEEVSNLKRLQQGSASKFSIGPKKKHATRWPARTYSQRII